jgi:hypothetical protein
MWHSCGRYRIADHFRNVDPSLRGVYRELRKAIQGFGPVTVYAQKSRIIFQTRARFAGVVVRKRWLDGGLWLKRRADDPIFRRIEFIAGRDYIHHFRLTEAAQIDGGLLSYLREAYDVGNQQLGSAG